MAYITKEEVKNIREKLKTEFPTYKFSVTKGDSSSVYISLMVSDLNLAEDLIKGYLDKEREDEELKRIEKGHLSINHHGLTNVWSGKTLEVLEKTLTIAKSQNWYDKSDSMTDCFNVAYYIEINIGKYDRPHQVKENI